MEGVGAGEFQDWEMLHNSDKSVVYSSDDNDSRDFGGIEGDSEGVIRSDYFALDSEKRYARTVADDPSSEVEGSVESDNPSWVDPGSEPRYGRNEVGFQGIAFERNNSGQFWSDSTSDGSVSRKFGDSEGKGELGFTDDDDDDAQRVVGLEGIGGDTEEIELKNTVSGHPSVEFLLDEAEIAVESQIIEGEGDLGFGDYNSKERDGLGLSSVAEIGGGSEEPGVVVESGVEGEGGGVEGEGGGVVPADYVEGEGGEIAEEMKNLSPEPVISGGGVVWWKLPLELLKFCVFRVSPVWSISIAAAVMGFVIMRRRLHRMKRKSQSLALKVTIEDKKVSQFMTRAARLNEAFSVVRRVPIIRPSLPAAGGLAPWPMMSLR